MSKLEQSASLNIAILADEQIAGQAIDLSRQLAGSYPTQFVLDQERFFPHITVYQAHFPLKNIPLIEKVLSEVTSQTNPFDIVMGEFSVRFDTFLFWLSQKSKDLQALHEQIVESTNYLRENLILPHLADVTGMSEADRSDMKNYGALGIGPRYAPHMTITRLSNNKDISNVLAQVERRRAIFRVNELILGNLGDHGTVNGVINTFTL